MISLKDIPLQPFFECSPLPMWIYDREELRFLAVNEAACQRYGYSREEFQGMTLRDIRPVEDIFEFELDLAHRRASSETESKPVWRHRTKSGQIMFVEVTVIPIEVQARKASLAILRPATNEQTLAAERESFLESSQDLMLVRGLDGKVIWVNQAVERLLGWSVQEAMDLSWPELVHPGDLEARDVVLDRLCVEGGSGKWEARYLTKGNTYIWMQWSCTVDLSSQRIYFVGRDVHQARILSDRLARNERNLARAQELARTGSWSYEVRTDTLSMSREYLRIFGIDAPITEMTWAEWLRYVHPDDQAMVETPEHFQSPLGSERELVLRILHPDEAVCYLMCRTQSAYDASGRLIRLDGMVRDVTDRHQAQEELSQVLTGAQCLLWQADVVERNGELDWSLGVRPSEFARNLLGEANSEEGSYTELFINVVVPEDKERLHRNSYEALRSGQPGYEQEYRVRTVGGEIRWLYEAVSIRRQSEGFWSLIGVCTDITERKQVQSELLRYQAELEHRVEQRTEQLRESEQRYRAIVQDQTEMISRHLADGTFIFVNEAHCRYFGARPEDLIGRSYFEFLEPERLKDAKAHLARLGPDNPVGTEETSHTTPDGRTLWHQWTTRYISDGNGNFQCFQAVGRDITERKEAEIAMRLAKEEAERANHAKSEFLSRMSHELRTPLNAILGFGQVLDRQNLDAISKESVQYVLKAGRHLLNLINEVLDIARVEAGRTDISLEPVEVAEVFAESCNLVNSLAEDRDVYIYGVSELTDVHVLADKQRLKQVLINLLSNAIKYNVPGGKVEISCRPTSSGAMRIGVRDTGLGMSPEDLTRLFVPFERFHPTSGVEGTGLGLALSQRLVALMGGILGVESKLGEGSHFYIELPPAEFRLEPVVEPSPSEVNTSHPRADAYSILCIEDNLSNLRLLEVVLAGRPEIVLSSAMQGSVGLDLAHHLKPKMILLDLNLPDLSGAQVLERLRQSPVTKDIPVIIVSADATQSQIDRLLDMGANAYLTKPLDIDELLRKIDESRVSSVKE